MRNILTKRASTLSFYLMAIMSKLKFHLSLCLLLVAAVFMVGFEFIKDSFLGEPEAAAQSTVEVRKVDVLPDKPAIQGRPVHIEISSVNISIGVQDGYYNERDKSWTLSDTAAHYAVNTPLANNYTGATFIYGHNKKEVFERLNDMKVGDIAIVTTDNGHKFTYELKSWYDTSPDDGSIFDYEGDPILILQTCSGFWYQNRKMFTFELKDVK